MINRKRTFPIIAVFAVVVFLSIAYYLSNQIRNTSFLPKPTGQETIELESSDFGKEAKGCGDFIVYKYSKDGGISVKVNNDAIQLSDKPIILDIKSTDNVEIIYAEGENLFETMPTLFCNDYSNPKIAKPKVWTANSGTVTVTNQGSSEKSLSGFDEYYVRVDLENIYLLDEGGKIPMNIHRLNFEKVLVGWYPG